MPKPYLTLALIAFALQSAAAPLRLDLQSLDDFHLPARSLFDRSLPRYPNVWFYVDSSLAESHEAVVKLVTDRLRAAMRPREFFPPFDPQSAAGWEPTRI